MPKLATHHSCTGCMGCIDVCPKQAISKHIGSDGHYYVKVDPEKCVECGLCERTCPVVNGSSYGKESPARSYHAAWSLNEKIRKRGATSGLFGAMAGCVIASGGVAVGVRMEGIRCRYFIIRSPEDLQSAQGSKYTASDPEGIYSEVRTELKGGRRVLFCGLPCHVAACLSVIPEALHHKLICVDLICGGVSSPALLEIFRKSTPDFSAVKSFRNKKYGWKPSGFKYNFTFIRNDGTESEASRDKKHLVTDGFACELTDRYSCYNCRFALPSRKSDITIGDLWGDKDYPAQHPEGVSLAMVHSTKGEELLREADISLNPVDPGKALLSNRRVVDGRSVKQWFPERRLFPFLSRHLSLSMLTRIYAGDLKTRNPLWWPLALWRLVSFRIAEKLMRRRSGRLIERLFRNQ